jgi:FtsZ-binding cell division protein ZapB
MSSSLLEQAIVDAEALKEAAIKNAESAILEKYSSEIKQAVDTLLVEQGPEDPLDAENMPPPMPPMDLEMPPMVEEEAPAGDDNIPEVPPAEGMCPCPAIDEQIDGSDIDTAGEVKVELTNVAAPLDEVLEIDFESLEREILIKEDFEKEFNITTDLIEEVLGEENTTPDIPDALIDSIIEKLAIDIDPVKSGWIERPISNIDLAADQAAATEELVDDVDNLQDTENKLNGIGLRQIEELHESNFMLDEENEQLTNQNIGLVEENKKFKTILTQLRDKLHEVNLSNAKLLYTNRILSDRSLNERQRTKIVESVAAATNVEEAKVIYETLQSTVGASPKRKRPETLSEVVNKNSSSTVSSQREVQPSQNTTAYNRMRILAGINN